MPSWGGAGGGHGSGWGANSLPPEQASHPFAADVHAVLATEPGPDLAIPFSGEGCGVQDLADQLDQVAIADRGGRTGPATGTGCGAAGRRGWSAARRAPGTPRPLVAGRPWLAGPLRRRDLQPPFVRRRPPGSRSPCQRPDLALGLPQRPIIARPVGPLPFRPSLPLCRKSSRQAASRWASTRVHATASPAARRAATGALRPSSCRLATWAGTGSHRPAGSGCSPP